jgi:hypothetical protein
MVPKPQRTLIDRVSGVHYRGGRVVAYPSDAESGRALFRAAANLIDAAR